MRKIRKYIEMFGKSSMRWSIRQGYFRMPPLLPLEMMTEE